MNENMGRSVPALLALTMLLAGCAGMRERRVQELCRFIRPDMMLSDANELFGWDAQFDSGDWYWTDSRKFVVHSGHQYRIVEAYDFYRLKHHHKLIDRPGVFERDIPKIESEGVPIDR